MAARNGEGIGDGFAEELCDGFWAGEPRDDLLGAI